MASEEAQTAFGVPILGTKLYVPRWRAGSVSRPRLVERLRAGSARALTLVSAPAGFGKTTLLAEWLGEIPAGGRGVAWVSLDETENDPARFWAYVVAALRTVRPGVGQGALEMLNLAPPPPIEAVLTGLINELAAVDADVVLVLDDLHVIDAPAVHSGIGFLLDHLPPRLHLVIASRSDPPLPLARLRGRGESVEIRAADLRFTPDEAAAFLNGAMGLDLSAADIAALDGRTEGWIAGLQLAALSMRGHQDISRFIRTFAGDHRYVVDYLVEEVLRRQPEPVRGFLLQTAILERLNGALCDAVTGRDDGAARLEALERGNFFVVSLDETRHWYRYHHLFADVLRVRLRAEHPERVSTLHRRASAWHERHGAAADAIRHALAAGDAARAADLVELAAPAMRRGRQEAVLLGWFRALPDDVFRYRPVLSALFAGALLAGGELEGVDDRLRDAERWLDARAVAREQPDASSARSSPPDEMVVVDADEFRRLPASIAVYRAGRALALGDMAGTVRYARRALDLVTEDDHLSRGAAAALLGLASWATGDLEGAHGSYADGMASLRRAGYIVDRIGGVIALADIRIAQGRLHEAMSTYRQALQLATERGAPGLRGTADMYVGMAELHRERNDLDAAAHHLTRSTELGESAGFPQNPYRWCVAMSRIREAHGDLSGALDLLREAERRYVSDFFPNVRPLAARTTRVWVAQGRLDDALGWAREQGLSAEDGPSYLREYEHVTLARVLLALSTRDRADPSFARAMGLLERLLRAAEGGKRAGSVIEILIVRALAHQGVGDVPAARASLERALALAEPEGYVRTFVDEGDSMRDLLRHAAVGGVASAYARRLLRAFDSPEKPASLPDRAVATALVEPLTAREVEILRLIAAGMRNQEIAERLYVGLPTVKRHIANAYGKLGVGHRTEAVARANELGLL